MSVYAKIVDVASATAYPATPQVVFPFEADIIAILNESDTSDVYVSLDGINDMGHLPPKNTAMVLEKQHCSKVWLKRGVVGISPQNVQVVGEA